MRINHSFFLTSFLYSFEGAPLNGLGAQKRPRIHFWGAPGIYEYYVQFNLAGEQKKAPTQPLVLYHSALCPEGRSLAEQIHV